jgi:acetyl-CoA acetyltransferase
MSGAYDIAIACGVESMTRVPMASNATGGMGPFSQDFLRACDGKLLMQFEVAQILAMSASEWKACWIERLEVAKRAKTESLAVINWSYAMDALRLQKRLADELLNAPRRVYVGSVFLGMF